MALNQLWSELRLDTRPFQAGLASAKGMASQFGKQVAGTMRSTFISAINPVAWLRSVVTATAAAQQTLAGLDQKRVEMQAGSVPVEDFQRLASIAEQFNLSLEKMVELWKENSKEAEVFRNVLAGEGKSGGPSFSGAYSSAKGFFGLTVDELLQYPRWTIPGMVGWFLQSVQTEFGKYSDDNSAGIGPGLQRLMDARTRRTARENTVGDAPLPFGGMVDFWNDQMLNAYRGRADVLSGAMDRFSAGRGGTPTISGYSGLVAASNAQLQTSLLQMIEQHTRVLATIEQMQAKSP